MRIAVAALLLTACEPDALYREPEGESPPRRAEPASSEPELEIPVNAELPQLPDTEVPVVWCDEQETISIQVRPLDVVLIVDNSGSMAEEIDAVQRNINQNLAQRIAATGIDYRVIVLSRHGQPDLSPDAETRSICVSSPLSDTDCNPAPPAPAITERFFHYSVEIGSRDAWCRVLLT